MQYGNSFTCREAQVARGRDTERSWADAGELMTEASGLVVLPALGDNSQANMPLNLLELTKVKKAS